MKTHEYSQVWASQSPRRLIVQDSSLTQQTRGDSENSQGLVKHADTRIELGKQKNTPQNSERMSTLLLFGLIIFGWKNDMNVLIKRPRHMLIHRCSFINLPVVLSG